MTLNPVRSAVAVIGGPVLLGFMDATLTTTLVGVIGQSPAADEAAALAIRNRPLVLVVTLITHALASTLTGYVVAKISGAYEVRHAMVAAAILTIVYGSALLGADPRLPPLWVRIAILIITPPALVGGAHIHAEARAVRAEQAGSLR